MPGTKNEIFKALTLEKLNEREIRCIVVVLCFEVFFFYRFTLNLFKHE